MSTYRFRNFPIHSTYIPWNPLHNTCISRALMFKKGSVKGFVWKPKPCKVIVTCIDWIFFGILLIIVKETLSLSVKCQVPHVHCSVCPIELCLLLIFCVYTIENNTNKPEAYIVATITQLPHNRQPTTHLYIFSQWGWSGPPFKLLCDELVIGALIQVRNI